MRQGELLALRWDCVDFDAGAVRVKRTVWKGKVYPPKSQRSNRTVRLSQMAIHALWEHRQTKLRMPCGASPIVRANLWIAPIS